MGVRGSAEERYEVASDAELVNINAGVSQLAMSISNEIDETAYDLNAAAFSESTVINKDYILDNIELNFSTIEAKTITVTSSDGTILWGGSVDTSASNLGYNTTKQHFFLSFGRGFNASENITVAVTQFSSAGTMDCILKIQSGTNTLLGDPVVQGEDLVAGGNYPLPLDRNGIAVPTIMSDHSHIHKGEAYSASDKVTGLNTGDSFDILLKNPAGNFPHFRVFEFDSDKSPGDIFIYEAPTTSADGTPLTLNNLNRNSSNTPDLSVFTEPTLSDVGTRLEYHQITGTKASGGSSQSATTEWILKTNTDYLVRFTAGANGTIIGWYIFFYEG